MSRFFNTAGPANPADHYYLPPLSRIDLGEVRNLMDQKILRPSRPAADGEEISRSSSGPFRSFSESTPSTGSSASTTRKRARSFSSQAFLQRVVGTFPSQPPEGASTPAGGLSVSTGSAGAGRTSS